MENQTSLTSLSATQLFLPPHLTPLPSDSWLLWRYIGLRAAGFPIQDVFKLASPDCCRAADQLLAAQTQVEQVREFAQQILKQALNLFASEPTKKKQLSKALRKLYRMNPPGEITIDFPGRDILDKLDRALADVAESQAHYAQAFANAIQQQAHNIHTISQNPRFQEAVIWQNYQAWESGIKKATTTQPGKMKRNFKARYQERQIAFYLQRYCTKNDTIGFFGPVNWAEFVPHGPPVVIHHPEGGFLANRDVFIESWGLETLVDLFAKDSSIRPWVAPRLNPIIGFDSTKIYIQSTSPETLSPQETAVLKLCNGHLLAKEIVAQLLENQALGFKDEQEIYGLLDYLEATGIILWNYAVPRSLDALETLRRLLNQIEDETLRLEKINILDNMEAVRASVVWAAGNPQELATTLENFNTLFSELTSAASTKSAGQTYGARTLLYEECRRNLQVEFGPDILDRLGSPLSLLLASARWLVINGISHFQTTARHIYDRLAQHTKASDVQFIDFWAQFTPLIYNADDHYLQPIVKDFQARWAQIFTIPPGEKRVAFHSQDIKTAVAETFACVAPDYPITPYHSPDVMIAAPDAAAIRAGNYQLVLGELHSGRNTLNNACFVCQHPSPEQLQIAHVWDNPRPHLALIHPRDWAVGTARLSYVLHNPEDYQLVISYDGCGDPARRVLNKGDLTIREEGDELIIGTRDGTYQFLADEFIANIVDQELATVFKIFPSQSYLPRITLDQLVIQRETWAFSIDELTFDQEKEEEERFLAARALQRRYELPRFVFIKTPLEDKPFYMDFDSIVLVNNLVVQVRHLRKRGTPDARLVMTEMLPSPMETWVSDDTGQHYTSELRIIAVDRELVGESS